MARIRGTTVLAGAFCLLAGDVPLPARPLQAQDGFLFRAPQAQLTLRAGPSLPRADGALFDFMTSELTLERSDFRAPALSGELSMLLGNRWELGASLGVAESVSRSEYARLIGDDGLPIEQTTKLRTVPVTATARHYPMGRGRSVSSLAWIPARTTPYIGGGAGMTWYRLTQEGEFVEHETGDIFLNRYDSAANALTLHAVAGANHWFTARVGLNAEARYTRGSADLTGSYRQYDRVDLTGLQAMIGLSLRW
jgi:hypothetical protein